jgi:hypothetical protein
MRREKVLVTEKAPLNKNYTNTHSRLRRMHAAAQNTSEGHGLITPDVWRNKLDKTERA